MGTAGYLILAPGGGLDIHVHRFTMRAIDYEYQHWTNFQNSTLSPDGFSSGIAYRILLVLLKNSGTGRLPTLANPVLKSLP